ncbi:MAG: hypothetical protein KDD53_09600, partial [Bdellovibrionales bacterium]|nr:hypothetical protein [Bdellovibrionales bacterium]
MIEKKRRKVDSSSLAPSDEDKDLRVAIFRVITADLFSELTWRVPILVLGIGAFIFLSVLFFGTADRSFGGWWLSLAIFEAAIHFQMFRQRELRKVLFYASIASVGTLLWWALLPVFMPQYQIL